MATSYNHYRLQIRDEKTGRYLSLASTVKVVTVDTLTKVALVDNDAASVSNPLACTNGKIEFNTAESVTSVDIYGLTENGDAFVCKNFAPGGNTDAALINPQELNQVLMIPVDCTSAGDNLTTTEFDTGFDLPANVAVMPWGIGADVRTILTSATFDLGLLSSESGGDADGLLNDLSVGTAAYAVGKASTTAGTIRYYASTTLGALLAEFAAGASLTGSTGINNVRPHVGDGTAKSFSITMSAGATPKFLVIVPLMKGGALV